MSYDGSERWYHTTDTSDDPSNQPDNNPVSQEQRVEMVVSRFDSFEEWEDKVESTDFGPFIERSEFWADVTGDGTVNFQDKVEVAEGFESSGADVSSSSDSSSSGGSAPDYAGRTPDYAQTDDPSTERDESNPYDDYQPNAGDETQVLAGMDQRTLLILGGLGIAGVLALR